MSESDSFKIRRWSRESESELDRLKRVVEVGRSVNFFTFSVGVVVENFYRNRSRSHESESGVGVGSRGRKSELYFSQFSSLIRSQIASRVGVGVGSWSQIVWQTESESEV